VSGLNHVAHNQIQKAQDNDPKINIEVTDKIVDEHTYQDKGKEYTTPLYEAVITGEDIAGNPIKETFSVTRFGVKNGKVQSYPAGEYKVTKYDSFVDGNPRILGLRINGSRYLFHTQSNNRADLNYGCIAMNGNDWTRFMKTIINAGYGLDLGYIAENKYINVKINYAPTPIIKWK
jgi:hypothetical protein